MSTVNIAPDYQATANIARVYAQGIEDYELAIADITRLIDSDGFCTRAYNERTNTYSVRTLGPDANEMISEALGLLLEQKRGHQDKLREGLEECQRILAFPDGKIGIGTPVKVYIGDDVAYGYVNYVPTNGAEFLVEFVQGTCPSRVPSDMLHYWLEGVRG